MIALHQNCKIYKNLNKKSTARFEGPKNGGGPGQVPRLPMRKSGPGFIPRPSELVALSINNIQKVQKLSRKN